MRTKLTGLGAILASFAAALFMFAQNPIPGGGGGGGSAAGAATIKGTPTTGNCSEFASATSIQDAGAPCGSSSGATITGTPTVGNCAEFDSTTSIQDAGAPCGGGGLSVSGGYLTDGSNYYITGPQLALATRTTCGAFTPRNMGSSTCTDNADGSLTLTPTISATDSLRILEVTPGSTFTATAHITCSLPFANYFNSGIALVEDGTGKVVNWGVGANSAASQYGAIFKNVWTNVTTFSSQTIYSQGSSDEWLRVQLDSTNLTFFLSVDGVDFRRIDQTTKGTGFTTAPDRVGWMVDNSNASLGASCTLRSWLVI